VRRAAVVIALALVCLGCDEMTKQAIQQISYFRDERTGLCFAAMDLGTRGGVLTNVPCESVRHLLK
jgi:hypothetical protein